VGQVSSCGSEKSKIALISRLRTARGLVNTVHVVELTLAGCLIDQCALSVRQGERVLLRMPSLRYLAANVVWNEEGSAGLAFEEPLYEPVLDHMLRGFRVVGDVELDAA